MLNLAKRVTTDESGASSAEYGILVALVAGVVVLAIPIFGTGLNAMFTKLGTYLGGLVP